MKTHQKIHDAIKVAAPLGDCGFHDQVIVILHAMNDRIDRLEEATRACLVQTEKKHDALNDRIAEVEKWHANLESRFEEIHPTIQ